MTEKRFTLIKDTGTDECYSDNLYDNGTYIGAICGGSEMICYLLNNLNEENQDLATKKEDAEYELLHLKEKYEELLEENEKQEKTIQQLQKDSTILIHSNIEYRKENKKLIKMLDNVANYMQKQNKNISLDDFVEWWNNIATEGLE